MPKGTTRTTKRAAKSRAATTTKRAAATRAVGARHTGASTKRPAVASKRPAPAPVLEDALAEHNRLRAIMGLAPVAAPIVADPELDEGAKMRRLSGKRSALAIIDTMYAGEGPVPPTGLIIHWWGQFSDTLPAPFTLREGGHGYAEARDLEHATRAFAKLRDAVLAMKTRSAQMKLKSTREWAGISKAGDGWYRWMLPDERQMTVVFKSRAKLTKAERRERILKLA